MDKNKAKRKYRINLFIEYANPTCVNRFQRMIHELIGFLAWIYKFDYAISVDHQFSSESDCEQQSSHIIKFDLVYIRSGKETKIELKDFRRIINDTFGKYLSVWSDGVEIDHMSQNRLVDFPFPDEFHRPLNYPYVEVHKRGESKICIPRSFVEGLLEDDELNSSSEHVVLN